MDSGPVNSSTAVSKLHSSSGIIGELCESTNAPCLAQNSSAKPLDSTVNPVGASVGSLNEDWDSLLVAMTTVATNTTHDRRPGSDGD